MKNRDFLTTINEGFINAGRYFVAVASILTILASGFLIFAGIWEFVNGIPNILVFLFERGGHHVELSVHFISAIDLFMVAVVMFVMGIGLFELFVDKDQSISYPYWLKIKDLNDLKEKLIAAAVVVIVITFLKHIVMWKNPLETLYFGGSIAIVIMAITLFSKFIVNDESRKKREETKQ
ncbi:MAG: YqhA family protein [Candidatus Brocadia sp.]|nr:YqhA family protein [Candidatus Brocadia sp.]NUO07936.1 YqhA family protein [Candidatus Brocadia sp.]